MNDEKADKLITVLDSFIPRFEEIDNSIQMNTKAIASLNYHLEQITEKIDLLDDTLNELSTKFEND